MIFYRFASSFAFKGATQNQKSPPSLYTQLHLADILRFFTPQTHIIFTRAILIWKGKVERKLYLKYVFRSSSVEGGKESEQNAKARKNINSNSKVCNTLQGQERIKSH